MGVPESNLKKAAIDAAILIDDLDSEGITYNGKPLNEAPQFQQLIREIGKEGLRHE